MYNDCLSFSCFGSEHPSLYSFTSKEVAVKGLKHYLNNDETIIPVDVVLKDNEEL
jgi:hypothetical protein